MAILRTTTTTSTQAVNAAGEVEVGATPPVIRWTVVKGDYAAFRSYVEDDSGNPITPEDYQIKADFRRGTELLFSITPQKTEFDNAGEFTVSITPAQCKQLQSGDIFDVQLSDAVVVWTVCRGIMTVISEVTDR
jgi:hypothetical protein